MTDAQTTFARATLEYDKAHERALMEAITRAIFESSTVSDANAIVIRTAEAAEAVLTVLAGILAMSPAAIRSPTAIHKTVDEFGKRLPRTRNDNLLPSGDRCQELREMRLRLIDINDTHRLLLLV